MPYGLAPAPGFTRLDPQRAAEVAQKTRVGAAMVAPNAARLVIGANPAPLTNLTTDGLPPDRQERKIAIMAGGKMDRIKTIRPLVLIPKERLSDTFHWKRRIRFSKLPDSLRGVTANHAPSPHRGKP